MEVRLSQQSEQIVQAKVQSGNYASASEIVDEALRLLEHHEDLLSLDSSLPQKIEEGWLAAQRGDLRDGEALFEHMDAELSRLERSSLK